MRNLCLVLAAITISTSPAFAETGTAATTASVEGKTGQKTVTKRVCKRVADVNSLVAKKVCRVVEVDANSPRSANQQAAQRGAGAGTNEE